VKWELFLIATEQNEIIVLVNCTDSLFFVLFFYVYFFSWWKLSVPLLWSKLISAKIMQPFANKYDYIL
jgi:hypothetical protein